MINIKLEELLMNWLPRCMDYLRDSLNLLVVITDITIYF